MKTRFKNEFVNWDLIEYMKKMPSSSVDFILADFPDTIDQFDENWLKKYKDYLYYILCLYYTIIKTNGNIVIFFNKDYVSWIGAELKKFPLFTYKWPLFFKNDWNNIKNNIVKNRYDVGYWLVEDDMINLNVNYKLEKHLMTSRENTKQSVFESLIINFTKPGDCVLNCFSWPSKLWKFCNEQWRHCISVIN